MFGYDQSRVYQPYRTFRPRGSHPNPAHWQSIRLQALERDGHQCRCCPAKQGNICPVTGPVKLEVHHRHYNTWGKESLDDVTVLCKECHRGVTDRFMWWRDKGRIINPIGRDVAPLDPLPARPTQTISLPISTAVQYGSLPASDTSSKKLPIIY